MTHGGAWPVSRHGLFWAALDFACSSKIALIFGEAVLYAECPCLSRMCGDEQKVAIVRVTRQNGSWIPEIVKHP